MLQLMHLRKGQISTDGRGKPTRMDFTEVSIKNVLTRTTGYLNGVTSHSLQPYRGCTFGRALCGVGCYVQHNGHILRGRRWGEFLEVRINAAESFRENVVREARWARRSRGEFSVFLSSATDPFLPQEFRYHITQSVLAAMLEFPPDRLILQTHSHRVTEYLELIQQLSGLCDVRVHVSIESDRDRLPGLPPPASSVEDRIYACGKLRRAGQFVVATVAPLLPIEKPSDFFKKLGGVASAVIIDHYIEGDGSDHGARTLKTELPAAMRQVDPASISLDYRERMVEIAREILPGRVGVGKSGFSGVFE